MSALSSHLVRSNYCHPAGSCYLFCCSIYSAGQYLHRLHHRRVIDTGIGVIFSLVLNFLLPSKLDKRNGFDFPHTFQRWFKSNQRPSNERYPLDPEPEGNPEQSYEKKGS